MILAFVILTGCSTSIDVKPSERLQLNLDLPQPLTLESVEWDVLIVNDTPYFSLDESNFKRLNLNTERVQNRLHLQQQIIESQRKFYEENLL